MTATGAWIVEDSSPAPTAGVLIWSDLLGPVQGSPSPRVGGTIWPTLGTLALPSDWYESARQPISLTQVAVAQPPVSGGGRSAIQTLTLSQLASGRRGVLGTVSQPIDFTQAAVGFGNAFRTALQTLPFTQDVSGRRGVVGTALQPLPLTQDATPRGGVVGEALQTISLTQSASGRRGSAASAIQTVAFDQAASGTRDSEGTAAHPLPFTQEASATKQARGTAVQTVVLEQLARPARLILVALETITLAQEAEGVRGVRGISEALLALSNSNSMAILSRRGTAVQPVSLAQRSVANVDLVASSQFLIFLQQRARPADLDISLLPIPRRPDVIVSSQGDAQGGPADAPDSGGVLISTLQLHV